MHLGCCDDSRFWSKVEPNPDGCWIWTGYTIGPSPQHQYGCLWRNGERWLAHRYVWKMHFGRLPRWINGSSATTQLLHSCDMTLCVNIRHLRLGTQGDNVREAAAKGHYANRPHADQRGYRNPNVRLTEDQVRSIRSERQSGRTLQSIANEFSVHVTTIHRITTKRLWSSLD